MGHVPPIFQMTGHQGAPWVKQQKTDQTVQPITKALTKTTNCTCRQCRAKKWRGTTKIVLALCVGRALQISSCTTDPGPKLRGELCPGSKLKLTLHITIDWLFNYLLHWTITLCVFVAIYYECESCSLFCYIWDINYVMSANAACCANCYKLLFY